MPIMHHLMPRLLTVVFEVMTYIIMYFYECFRCISFVIWVMMAIVIKVLCYDTHIILWQDVKRYH